MGFDSESKPTFNVGEVSTGPHLIQLATLEKAYLFQLNDDIWQFLQPVFANRDQIKVGFGLKNDAHLFGKKGIQLNSVIELSKCFGSFGFKSPLATCPKMPWHYYFTFTSLKAEVLAPQIGHANSSVKHKLPMLLPMPTPLVLIFEEFGAFGSIAQSISQTVHSNCGFVPQKQNLQQMLRYLTILC